MHAVDHGKRLAFAVLRPFWAAIRRSPLGPAATRLAGRIVRSTEVTPAVTDDLVSWCTDRAIPVHEVSRAVEHVRTPPVALGEVLPRYEERRTARVPERYLVLLEDARVWGDHGIVVLPDGSVAAPSIYGPSHLVDDPSFRRPLPLRTRTVPGDVLLLSGEYSNTHNWFHWIHEGALRLHGVLDRLPPGTRVLVPADLPQWKADTLRLLGIPESRLLRYRGRDGAVFERLWFPSLPPTAAHHPEAVDWLRRRLLEAAGVRRCAPSRRLFVSRADASHARIVDEAALAPVLAERGFAEASHVVGPTGAGFTNLLFADPATRVLELLEPRWAAEKAFVIWAWAETLGQPHAYWLGETVADPENPERADLSVDPATFARVLDRWLATEPSNG